MVKICWDKIESASITRNGILKINNRYFHIIKCESCGDDFLGRKGQCFCGNSCSQTGLNNTWYIGCSEETRERLKKNLDWTGKHHTEESKRKIGKAHKGKVISKETRKKISESLSGDKHPNYGKYLSEETRKRIGDANIGQSRPKRNKSPLWKGGYNQENIPTYDLYKEKLEWCEEIRRNKDDSNILEVKCTYCGRWFVSSREKIRNRINTLNGIDGYLGEQRFYCSNGCKKACPIYGKTPETLMKEDAVRAGRLNWLEMNREVQPELRQMVLKRDKYKCIKCNSIEELHCHHILPVATDPLVSADMDNCITLCTECHKEVHKQDGCGYGQLEICI